MTFGLGRGLESLIPKKIIPQKKTSQEEVIKIDIQKILPNPHQPRKKFDKLTLLELAESIKEHGIIQPLVVTKIGENQYQLITGERRLEAAKLAQLQNVPVIIRDASEQQKLELSIIENIQRHDLNPIEQAKAFKKLCHEFGLTQEAIAVKVGKSREAIANKLRLLNLPLDIQKSLVEGKITEGHAKTLLTCELYELQLELFKKILERKASVRQLEKWIKDLKYRFTKRKIKPETQEIQDFEEKLEENLGTAVDIKILKRGGQIIINFYSKEELKALIDKICGDTHQDF